MRREAGRLRCLSARNSSLGDSLATIALGSMIRTLLNLAILVLMVIFATTVPLGGRTLFGHLSRIWEAEETQELVEGVKESSKPMVEKVKRGVQAGLEEIAKDEDAGVRDAGTSSDSGVAAEDVRDRAAAGVAEKAGELAKDAVSKEVEEKLKGE